jgi:hypothetical protein
MDKLHYILIGVIVVVLIFIIVGSNTSSNTTQQQTNCVDKQSIKSKLSKQLFELNLSYKGPLLSFSKKLITVKNFELILQDSPDSSFTKDDLWFFDSNSKKLQHIASGMYLKTNVSGEVKLVSVKSEGSDFIYNKGSFQEAEYPNCLSVMNTQITLGTCGLTSALFFTGANGQFSFDNKTWYSEPDLISSFI